ncbi:MAG: DUF5702 domain-containing protein [Lachnospiraceae bacterium]|nr:DUF5702 domain-containing protein [Lachnospiraceae bacterium]
MDDREIIGHSSFVRGENGAVTVFLTLVFSLVFSLTMVSLEAARSAATRAFAQMLLSAAAESVAADFYRPLFDEYHLFGLYTGTEGGSSNPGYVAEEVRSKIGDNVWGLNIQDCVTENEEQYLDPEAGIFTTQASKYEMLGAAEGVLSLLGEKIGLISGQDQSAKVLQKKLDAESKFARIDELTMELMKHVDGVNCSVGDTNGVKYKAESKFAKRLFVGSMSSQTLQMRYLEDFSQLSSRYCDAMGCLDRLYTSVCSFASEKAELERLYEQLDLTGDPDAARSIKEAINDQNKVIKPLREECKKLSSELKEACSDSELKTREALNCMERICDAQDEAIPGVGEYENIIAESEGQISEDELTGHNEALMVMKKHLGEGSSSIGINYDSARLNLERNGQILENCDYSGKLAFSDMSSDEAYSRAEEILELRAALSEISYDGLRFDYSGFAAPKEDIGTDPEFAGNLLENLENGLLNLILGDEAEVSENSIETVLLPSSRLDTMEEDIRTGADGYPSSEDPNDGAGTMSGVIGGSALDEISSVNTGEQGPTGDEAGTDHDGTDEGGNNAVNKGLTIIYLHDHFDDYTDQTEAEDTVLKYEQEYIVCGKDNDKDNLSCFLTELLLLRTVSAILYIMSDREITAKAESAAVLAVGFTGLPFLIKMIEYLILFVWAYEQAVIEVAALTMGKKIPVITCRECFCLDIRELVSFSSGMVHEKAENLTDTQQGIGYREYLMIFMMLHKHRAACYRGMDLIQENLRYEYDEDFLLSGCIDGFSVKAVFNTGFRFIGFGGYEMQVGQKMKY